MSWQRVFYGSVLGAMVAAAGAVHAADVASNDAAAAQMPQGIKTARLPVTGLVEDLSPGNRLIAESLHAAQRDSGSAGSAPWTLERIAAARLAGRNWGDVFQEMKTDNLLQADTLGQVVTWYQYYHVTPEPEIRTVRPAVATIPVGGN